MRNLKTTDGLTRGSGMNESPRLVWLLSTPGCMGDPGGFGHCQLLFTFFSYHVHVIKLIFRLKKETHYAYG